MNRGIGRNYFRICICFRSNEMKWRKSGKERNRVRDKEPRNHHRQRSKPQRTIFKMRILFSQFSSCPALSALKLIAKRREMISLLAHTLQHALDAGLWSTTKWHFSSSRLFPQLASWTKNGFCVAAAHSFPFIIVSMLPVFITFSSIVWCVHPKCGSSAITATAFGTLERFDVNAYD